MSVPGRRSSAFQVLENVDLQGKTALVTGVNSGLGQETMRVLAARGARVIGAARSLEKAQQACDRIEGDTLPVACELSDLASVAACADTVQQATSTLDILICNAGIMALPKLKQVNGLELQFATNHLGHFLLISRLLDSVVAADAGRIVLVSSAGHVHTPRGGIDFDNLSGSKGYDAWRFYGQSKLANLLTSTELARRLAGGNATSNAVHPGVINTNLARETQGLFSSLITLGAGVFGKSIACGAATQCYVAAHPALEGKSGGYFADCRERRPSRFARDGALAKRLWTVSEELLADYL